MYASIIRNFFGYKKVETYAPFSVFCEQTLTVILDYQGSKGTVRAAFSKSFEISPHLMRGVETLRVQSTEMCHFTCGTQKTKTSYIDTYALDMQADLKILLGLPLDWVVIFAGPKDISELACGRMKPSHGIFGFQGPLSWTQLCHCSSVWRGEFKT